MLLLAFARPLWAATLRILRDLTRLAATALVLIVGIGGLTTAPATTAVGVTPPVATSQVAELRPVAVAVTERADDAPAERAAEVPVQQVRKPASRPLTAIAVNRADPGRDAVGRRGPPHA